MIIENMTNEKWKACFDRKHFGRRRSIEHRTNTQWHGTLEDDSTKEKVVTVSQQMLKQRQLPLNPNPRFYEGLGMNLHFNGTRHLQLLTHVGWCML